MLRPIVIFFLGFGLAGCQTWQNIGEAITESPTLTAINTVIGSDTELCESYKEPGLYEYKLDVLVAELERRGASAEDCVALVGDTGIFGIVHGDKNSNLLPYRQRVERAKQLSQYESSYFIDVAFEVLSLSDTDLCSKHHKTDEIPIATTEAKRRGLECEFKATNHATKNIISEPPKAPAKGLTGALRLQPTLGDWKQKMRSYVYR